MLSERHAASGRFTLKVVPVRGDPKCTVPTEELEVGQCYHAFDNSFPARRRSCGIYMLTYRSGWKYLLELGRLGENREEWASIVEVPDETLFVPLERVSLSRELRDEGPRGRAECMGYGPQAGYFGGAGKEPVARTFVMTNKWVRALDDGEFVEISTKDRWVPVHATLVLGEATE